MPQEFLCNNELKRQTKGLVSVLTTSPEIAACFGNPAVPEGPVAFRPTITRGLAFRLFENVIDAG